METINAQETVPTLLYRWDNMYCVEETVFLLLYRVVNLYSTVQRSQSEIYTLMETVLTGLERRLKDVCVHHIVGQGLIGYDLGIDFLLGR